LPIIPHSATAICLENPEFALKNTAIWHRESLTLPKVFACGRLDYEVKRIRMQLRSFGKQVNARLDRQESATITATFITRQAAMIVAECVNTPSTGLNVPELES
jgi:hypothetical protein